MPPERRAKIDALTHELLAKMPLQELLRARELAQQQVASTLHLDQAEVEKIEGNMDLYLSTLRRFIVAMGGELQVIASFPNGDVAIQEFQRLETSQQSS